MPIPARLKRLLIVYQELIHELPPALLVETGTLAGGSAMFYASIFDLVGKGAVLSIDHSPRESLPPLEFLARHGTFQVDRTRERFHLTANPHGFLRRIG
jgi:cephalosporin hydroxylase